MTNIYVGDRNVTNDVGKFQRMARGSSIDGNFNGGEKKRYIQAINYLQNKGVIPKEKAARFRALINSKCYNNAMAGDDHAALYESLTEFIESNKFDKVRDRNVKASLAGLQLDVYQRLRNLGYAIKQSQYLGTSSETPYTPFKTDKKTWEYAQNSPLDLRTCQLDYSRRDIENEEESNHSRYVKNEASNSESGSEILQSDMRYSEGYVPKTSAKVADTGKPAEKMGDMGNIEDTTDLDEEWN